MKLRKRIALLLLGLSMLLTSIPFPAVLAEEAETEEEYQPRNVALMSFGSWVEASSAWPSPDNTLKFQPNHAIDGKRTGDSFWNDGTQGEYPDSLEVHFRKRQTIDTVNVFSVADDYDAPQPAEPTEETVFTQHGCVDFYLEYLTDEGQWELIPGSQVTGNDKVWKKITFDPLTTTAVRIVITKSASQLGFSYISELEVWSCAASPDGYDGENAALLENGAFFSASSTFSGYSTDVAGDGNRAATSFWNDNSLGAFPDWLQVDFDGRQYLERIDLFMLADEGYYDKIMPDSRTPSTQFSPRDFKIQYLTENGEWQTIPGADVTGNDKAWQTFSFDTILTSSIRVYITDTMDSGYSRIAELEAWTSAPSPDEPTVRSYTNVPYVEGSVDHAQMLDIELPRRGYGPYPAILFIHGGAWVAGDKSDDSFFSAPEQALAKGYAVVNVNYRLAQDAAWPAQIYDCKAALRHIRANAEKYMIDPDAIAVWGASAGGHLAMMMGVTQNNPEMEDLTMGNAHVSSEVQAVIDWFGISDVSTWDDEACRNHNNIGDITPRELMLGKGFTTEEALAASPITYVDENTAPMLIAHGTADPLVPFEQGENMAKLVAKAIGSELAETYYPQGAGHHDAFWSTDEPMKRAFNFLQKRFHPTENLDSFENTRSDGVVDMTVYGDRRHTIQYASQHSVQRLNLILPEEGSGNGRIPLIVFIHGGGFAAGNTDGTNASFTAEGALYALKRGYAVALVDYHTSVEGGFYPQPIYDIKAAIRCLRAKADEYHLDTDRFAIWGESAGGHLADFVALTNGNPEFEDLSMGYADYSSAVQAVISFYAITDLTTEMNAQWAPFLMGGNMGNEELMRIASPINQVTAEAPPFYLQHGMADTGVDYQDSVRLYEALVAANGNTNHRLELFPGINHAVRKFFTEENSNKLVDWLDEVMPQPADDNPTMVGELSVSDITSSSAKIGWQPAENAVQGQQYQVYLNDQRVETTQALSCKLENLEPNTKYTVTVKVKLQDNLDGNGISVDFTTLEEAPGPSRKLLVMIYGAYADLDPSGYTEESAAALLEALSVGEKVLAAENSTEEEMIDAAWAILGAAAGLVIDMSDLTAAAETAKNTAAAAQQAAEAIREQAAENQQAAELAEQTATAAIAKAEEIGKNAQDARKDLEESQQNLEKLTEQAEAFRKAAEEAGKRAEEAEKAVREAKEAYERARGQKDKSQPAATVQTGQIYRIGNYSYKVTSTEKRTVEVVGAWNKKLTKIRVDGSVTLGGKTYQVTSIAASAFKNNKKVRAAIIGKNVKVIGNQAFSGCAKLAKVTIKSTRLTRIGNQAFFNCKKLKNLTIKSKVLKKAGTNALEKIDHKAVIKVPAAKKEAYKKILAKKGQSKTVTIQ